MVVGIEEPEKVKIDVIRGSLEILTNNPLLLPNPQTCD